VDANAMLDKIVAEKWLTAKAVAGLWPANSTGDDIQIFRTGAAQAVATLHCLRQQAEKPDDRANFCLADFVAPLDSGRRDFVGAFAVNAGTGIEPHIKRFEADHDDYSSIMLKALADRFA